MAKTGHDAMADWGAWDEDVFSEAARLATESAPPFLGLAFTTSTHEPFQIPSAEYERFPPDTERNRYYNSIAYADACLGRLFERARREGWYSNTVFVVVSDHVSGMSPSQRSPPSLHHIPCFLIAPGIAPAVDRRIASQLDILPTLVDIAGFASPYAAFGRSLLEPGDRGAWCVRGNVVLRIEEQGWVVHDTQRRLSREVADDQAAADIEERLLAFVQVTTGLLKSNQVYRPSLTFSAVPR